ncbi:septation protein SepH [Actinomyces trachealis]|uniref:septation protein SepH n=1 Tax=Actinomyces trachealis TaxID=2763540 RepID=UPI0018929B8A|nr:septation protein SepH [Actinomyces trachealis]
MIDLELLGANGDAIVMTDPKGQRYKLIIDDALRAAVRRDRPAALDSPSTAETGKALTPREIQTLLRSGATAEEVAATTGLSIEHVHRFEGPVLAERSWAVDQARACRIGWEKDSPVLGELVVDRLATRGVGPEMLEWDAVREGRAPWEVLLTFVQGAEEKQARWVLDLSSRAVTALDDEARWLTEAASAVRRPAVFDQDSRARGASAQGGHGVGVGMGSRSVPPASPLSPADPPSVETADAAPSTIEAASRQVGSLPPTRPTAPPESTDALLADLAASRGMRVQPRVPEESGAMPVVSEQETAAARQEDVTQAAEVVSIADRRRVNPVPPTGNHPAGTRLAAREDDETVASPLVAQALQESPTKETEQVLSRQEELPDTPPDPAKASAKAAAQGPAAGSTASRSKRRSRRSVPSWDEIVFGAKPE